jgi:hypothetical protein
MLSLLVSHGFVWPASGRSNSKYPIACFRDENGRQRRITTRETKPEKGTRSGGASAERWATHAENAPDCSETFSTQLLCNYRCGLSFGSKVTPSRNAGAVTPLLATHRPLPSTKSIPPPPSLPTQEVRAVISKVRHRDSKSVFKKSHLSDAIEHKACCGDFDECLRALHAALVILAQSLIAAKPSEAALHNPGEAYDLERALPASDDLQLARG